MMGTKIPCLEEVVWGDGSVMTVEVADLAVEHVYVGVYCLKTEEKGCVLRMKSRWPKMDVGECWRGVAH